MNINRHNYESFFLLYTDGELAGTERSMVEAFVAANPDLREELQLLLQTRLTPNGQLDAAFLRSLLREEELSAPQQELALLATDDELTATQQEQLQQELQQSPALQQELALLKKTRLQPDAALVFPDKSLLYKKEQQPGVVLSFNLFARRFAAAAAVIFLLGTGWWVLFRTPPSPSEAVTVSGKTETSRLPTSGTGTQATNTIVENKNTSAASVGNTPSLQTTATAGRRQPVVLPAVDKTVANNSHQPAVIVNSTQQQEALVVQTTTEVSEKISESTSNIPTTSPVPSVVNNAGFASYSNADEDESDEEEGFFNEEQQRRSGIKGFFKKAKRTIERRTGISSGESQVRFAVFAIGTK